MAAIAFGVFNILFCGIRFTSFSCVVRNSCFQVFWHLRFSFSQFVLKWMDRWFIRLSNACNAVVQFTVVLNFEGPHRAWILFSMEIVLTLQFKDNNVYSDKLQQLVDPKG